MDGRTSPPHSPSARFYVNHQSQGPDTFGMFSHPPPDQQPHPQLGPPFSHFQGFSAPASSHRYINNPFAARLSDQGVSPRTAIPYHDHQELGPPRQHMAQIPNETNHILWTGYDLPQDHSGRLVHTQMYQQGSISPGRPRLFSEPPNYATPPPQYFSSAENGLAPAFAERPMTAARLPLQIGHGALSIPVQHHVPGYSTFRVPSASDTEQRAESLIEKGGDFDSDSGEDDNNTVYPYNSTSTSSSSSTACDDAAHAGIQPRSLEEAVVEVHDACLAATQRQLESLRVNWELRHGHDILTPSTPLPGPIRRLRDRRSEARRGCSPYPLFLRWWRGRRTARALSDNSGLEEYILRGLHGSEEGEESDGIRDHHLRRQHLASCPIPPPTDSLLQNTSRICELLWRRARRDRGDVPGAEAEAARRMTLILGCAERVVLCGTVEWEADPEGVFRAACGAGRDLCRELGDFVGAERVDGIERGEV